MNNLLKFVILCWGLCSMTSICFAGNTHAKIYFFVSFSMPEESLKEWIVEAKKLQVPIVIRGLVNNSFKETIQKMSGIIKESQGGVQIDPKAFKRFQIEKVPAVVVANDSSCLSNQTCQDQFDVVYGDVTPEYALSKIADQNDVASPVADQLLQSARERKNS